MVNDTRNRLQVRGRWKYTQTHTNGKQRHAVSKSTAATAACWGGGYSTHTDHEAITEHTRAQMRAQGVPAGNAAEDRTAVSALLMGRIKR